MSELHQNETDRIPGKDRPAVRYPDLNPSGDREREDPADVRKSRSKSGRGDSSAMRVNLFRIIRVLLYAAFAVWVFLFVREMFPQMSGLAVRIHIRQYLLFLLLPSVVIDLVLMGLRRIAFGKNALRRPGVDRWALSGLVILLAFVALVWYVLWTYVIREIAAK